MLNNVNYKSFSSASVFISIYRKFSINNHLFLEKQRNVVCNSSVNVRETPVSLNQLRVTTININLQTEEEVNSLKNLIAASEGRAGRFGSGLLGYIGRYNEAGTVFLGKNETTTRSVVRFLVEEGLKIFEELRNANVFSEMSISTIEGYLECAPPNNAEQLDKFQGLLETTRDNQQKKRKSVVLKKDTLEIGSKQSGSLLEVKPIAKANQTVLGVKAGFCFKQNYSKNLGYTLRTNPTVSVKDVAAYTILESLQLVTSSELLQHITAVLQKNFSVSQVISSKVDKSKRSKSGLYVVRSLTGVMNKLKEPSTAIETEAILLEWIQNQLATVPPSPKDQVQVLSKISNLLQTNALTTSSSAGRSTRKTQATAA